MFKKLILLTVILFSAGSLCAQKPSDSDYLTLLIMPSDPLSIQIGQDLSRRYPILLVSYQQVRGELKIHAWNGDQWIGVTAEDYAKGIFFSNRPNHAILVEAGYVQAPAVLTPSRIWCKSANRLTSTDPRIMIHLLGLYFQFPFDHWKQFAQRYDFALEEINPSLYNVHWWNSRKDLPIKLKTEHKLSTDLTHWRYLRTLPMAKINPFGVNVTSPVEKPETTATVHSVTTQVTSVTQTVETVEIKTTPAVVPIPAPPLAKPVILSNETVQATAPIVPPPPPAREPVPAIAAPTPTVKTVPAVNPTVTNDLAPVVKTIPVDVVAVTKPVSIKDAVPTVETVPAVKPALTNNLVVPVVKTAPMEAPKPTVETIPASLTNSTPAASLESEIILSTPDPFTTDEIPEAEIIIAPEPKKAWWK